MLTAELGSGGIQFVGKTIRRVGRQDVIGQIETVMVYDRVLSNQVKMISRHAERTRCPKRCSRTQPWPA